MMTGFGMGFGLIGIFLMLAFWVGLVFLAVWLVKSIFGDKQGSQPPTGGHRNSAREILDQRYARGEITREQYELMKGDLG